LKKIEEKKFDNKKLVSLPPNQKGRDPHICMATRIRFARRGRKKAPIYDIVVADSRSPRDGRFIEKLGSYNPLTLSTAPLLLNADRALYWLMVGALPTDSVESLFSRVGLMLRKHLQVGVAKGAITQEVADQRHQEWVSAKEAKLGHPLMATTQKDIESKTKALRTPKGTPRPPKAKPEQPAAAEE
jgi:small subunit ribosomal protein S16